MVLRLVTYDDRVKRRTRDESNFDRTIGNT